MGLSNFPSPAEGVLPMLVVNTLLSVTLFKNMVSSLLHVVSASSSPEENSSNNLDDEQEYTSLENNNEAPYYPRRRRISTTSYQTLCKTKYDENKKGGNKKEDDGIINSNKWSLMECCVCLNSFEGEEEVSELSCKHFFHKGCLDKWFHNQHTTCPLCRSIL